MRRVDVDLGRTLVAGFGSSGLSGLSLRHTRRAGRSALGGAGDLRQRTRGIVLSGNEIRCKPGLKRHSLFRIRNGIAGRFGRRRQRSCRCPRCHRPIGCTGGVIRRCDSRDRIRRCEYRLLLRPNWRVLKFQPRKLTLVPEMARISSCIPSRPCFPDCRKTLDQFDIRAPASHSFISSDCLRGGSHLRVPVPAF